MCDHGIDLAKSREVYRYCIANGIDTGVQIPIVMEISGNIILGERIIGHTGSQGTIIDEEDLAEALRDTITSP